MKKLIFVHGYTGSSKVDWYPAISKELDTLGLNYSIPDLPGGKFPHSKDWLEIIDKKVTAETDPVVLIGFSLGTRAVLLYLDKFEKKVDSVILVAAFDNNVDEERKQKGNSADFFEYALDLNKIKNLADRFIVMHSKDDPAINYQQGVDISKELGAKLITYPDRGHFCEPENAKYILEVIKTVL